MLEMIWGICLFAAVMLVFIRAVIDNATIAATSGIVKLVILSIAILVAAALTTGCLYSIIKTDPICEWVIPLASFIVSFLIVVKGKEGGEYAKIREKIINACIPIREFLKVCLRLGMYALVIYGIYAGFEYINSEYPSHAWNFIGGLIAVRIFADYIVGEIYDLFNYKINNMRDDLSKLLEDVRKIQRE
jgi:hypothetical protein